MGSREASSCSSIASEIWDFPLLWRVDIQLERIGLEQLNALLSSQGFDAFELQDSHTFAGVEGQIPPGEVRVVLYPEGEEAAARLLARVAQVLPASCAQSAPFDDQQWTEIWKRFIPAAVVRDRVVFRPTFRPSPRPDLPEVVIDPGLAFGTGSHETTRLACALALDALHDSQGSPAPIQRAADIGCGTAVIAAALVRCGCPEVHACDIDAGAIEVAQEVLALNGLSSSVNLCVGSTDTLPGTFPLVVANILAEKLLEIAEGLHRLTQPGGVIILSGILHAEVSEFLEAFLILCPATLAEMEREGDWAALRLNRAD